jgi:uncharacterized protein YbaR (Trm112 family)
MKLWLFDILSCICKYYPLKLYIFSYQNKEELFENYINSYNKKDMQFHKEEQIPEIIKGETIKVKDNIVIKETPIKEYYDKLVSSIEELNHIKDKTPYKASKVCLDLVKSTVKERVQQFRENPENKNIEDLLPELNLINKIKVNIEIQTGLLFCNECNRWYPIIDSIPRMLPDEYREKDEELQFLRNNEKFLDKEFLSKDLKPFKLN